MKLRRIVMTLKPGSEEGWGAQYVDAATGLRPVPGDAFYAPWYVTFFRNSLAPWYFIHNALTRPPVVVVLPNGDWFCVDSRTTSGGEQGDHGWQVSGDIETLSVSPSVNCTGRWHGYIGSQGVPPGEIGPDVDGRTF